MEYSKEDLLPIVGRLAQKYTAFESTSITYEKAEQLMDAVLYCIRAAEWQQQDTPVPLQGIPAWQAYELGAAAVEEKTRAALARYHEILPGFDCFGNRCLYETFTEGIPEFFRWYDVKFAPQETILTLDYPLLFDLSQKTGIERIYGFLECIHWEQEFLGSFPEGMAAAIVSRYHRDSEDLLENICGIVFMSFLGHILAQKPMDGEKFGKAEYERICRTFTKEGLGTIAERLEKATAAFVGQYCGSSGLLEYLAGALGDILFRLKTAAAYGALPRML